MRSLIFYLILLLTPLSVLAEPADPDPSSKAGPAAEKKFELDPEALAPPRRTQQPQPLAEAPELSLQDAFRRALDHSPTLEEYLSRIRESDYKIDEAYTLVSPTVNFRGQYRRVEPAVQFPGSGLVIVPADNYQFSLVIDQAIYTFGRLKWSAMAEKLTRRSRQEEYLNQLNLLVQETASRYFQAALAQELVAISRADLEAREANEKVSKLLFEQGVVARFDLLRNQSEASNSRQRLLEAENALTVARAKLMSILGESPETPVVLQNVALKSPENIALEQERQKALEQRPELRALRWARQAAEARIKLAESQNNPRLSLQNQTINQNAAGFSPGTQNTTFLNLDIPLFDGGVSRAQARQAEEAALQLGKMVEQQERAVLLELEELAGTLQQRWKAIEVAEVNVAQASEALRVAELRYQNGISTNVELLDAQAAELRAKFTLAEAISRYHTARWQWWRATVGEYPVDVPLIEETRARLNAEREIRMQGSSSSEDTGKLEIRFEKSEDGAPGSEPTDRPEEPSK